MDRKGKEEGKRNVDKWRELFGSEWAYVQRLGAAISDPQEKKAFWESVKARKLANHRYSIYQDFPKNEAATKSAMQECVEFVKSLRRGGTKGESA